MRTLRRILVPGIVLYNIVGLALIFLILSNSEVENDAAVLLAADMRVAISIALIGVLANLALAGLLWRAGLAARRQGTLRNEERQPRITGE